MPVFPADPEVRLRAGADAAPPWRVTRPWSLARTAARTSTPRRTTSPGGATIDSYPLERFVLDVRRHPPAGERRTGARLGDIAAGLPAEPAGRGVLLHTGWDEHWGGPAAPRHPFLSEDAARRLVAAGVGLVGTDALNVDATAEPTTRVHAALLGADVLVVENLDRPGGPGGRHVAYLRLRAAQARRRRRLAHPGVRLDVIKEDYLMHVLCSDGQGLGER